MTMTNAGAPSRFWYCVPSPNCTRKQFPTPRPRPDTLFPTDPLRTSAPVIPNPKPLPPPPVSPSEQYPPAFPGAHTNVIENPRDHGRGQAHARPTEPRQPGPANQRPADREHLLPAPRQGTTSLVAPFREPRKQTINAF